MQLNYLKLEIKLFTYIVDAIPYTDLNFVTSYNKTLNNCFFKSFDNC